jgi:hypothetical protein
MIVRSVNWLLATILSCVEKIIMAIGIIVLIGIIGCVIFYIVKTYKNIRYPNLGNANVEQLNII